MRLSVCLLLVTLALCCYEANAVVCPVIASEITGFLFAGEKVFRQQLSKFHAPQDAVQAKMKVKKCIDQISLPNRMMIEKILGKILLKCL
ncbi:secretoglobin family 1D member 1 [Otolemur garnettii]|uniref:secretoglobin family 1D member 1 n=1 Tax=Otolemur garnettii TaxID=30611 RepID=UPI000C7F19F6|nr:secretoglobin family 1D member 1 [Otolemur garnettii]